MALTSSRAKQLLHRNMFVACFSLIGLNSIAFGQSPSVEGDWHFGGLTASTRLQEVYYNMDSMSNRTGETSEDFAMVGEQLVDMFFPGTFGITDVDVAFNAGAISGSLTGSYALGEQGRMTVTLPDQVLTSYLNLSRDTFVIPVYEMDEMSFNIGTRLPSNLTVPQLAGAWQVVVMTLPRDLKEAYYNFDTDSTRQADASSDAAGVGEMLVDVFFPDRTSVQRLSINVDASGNITGDITGTASVNGPGNQTATFNLTGVGPLTFYPNAGVNVMSSSFSESENHQTVLAVRQPASAGLADLEGVWRWQVMEFPARLQETYYNIDTDSVRTSFDSTDFAGAGEQLVDVFFPYSPETDNGLVTIDAAGNVTGSDAGTMTVNGTTFTFTPSIVGDPAFQLYPNNSKDVLVGSITDPDSLSMLTLVKVSGEAVDSFDELVDVKVELDPGGELDLQWNESTSFKLYKSNSLSGWDPVDGTTGEGGFSETPGVNSGFYRIEVVD